MREQMKRICSGIRKKNDANYMMKKNQKIHEV